MRPLTTLFSHSIAGQTQRMIRSIPDPGSSGRPCAEEGFMSYVDGFVWPVPLEKLPAYRRMMRKCGKISMEHGALAYTDCVADANVWDGFKT
jgi:Protein of unknown function (DUF1428)